MTTPLHPDLTHWLDTITQNFPLMLPNIPVMRSSLTMKMPWPTTLPLAQPRKKHTRKPWPIWVRESILRGV